MLLKIRVSPTEENVDMLLLQDACLSNENMERKVAQSDLGNDPMHFENNEKNHTSRLCFVKSKYIYMTRSVLTYHLLISVQYNVLNVRL